MGVKEVTVAKRSRAVGIIKEWPFLLRRQTGPDSMLSRYPSLAGTIASFPFDQRENITETVARVGEGSRRQGRKLLEAVDSLVQSRTLYGFKSQIGFYTHAQLRELPQLLRDPLAVQVFDAMVGDISQSHQPQIVVYTGLVRAGDLSSTSREILHIAEAQERFSLNRGISTAELCSAAESRLEESMRNGSVVAVNDKFLVKFTGKFVGLCMESFTTPTGDIFLAGNWYKPFSGQLRTQLKDAYLNGDARVRAEKGEWTLLRIAEHNGGLSVPKLVEAAQKYNATAPDRLPTTIDGLSRQEYWRKTRETFPKV